MFLLVVLQADILSWFSLTHGQQTVSISYKLNFHSASFYSQDVLLISSLFACSDRNIEKTMRTYHMNPKLIAEHSVVIIFPLLLGLELQLQFEPARAELQVSSKQEFTMFISEVGGG